MRFSGEILHWHGGGRDSENILAIQGRSVQKPPEVSRTEVSYTLKYNNLSQQLNKYPPATTRTPGYLTEPSFSRAGASTLWINFRAFLPLIHAMASRLMEVPYLFMLGFWTTTLYNADCFSSHQSFFNKNLSTGECLRGRGVGGPGLG